MRERYRIPNQNSISGLAVSARGRIHPSLRLKILVPMKSSLWPILLLLFSANLFAIDLSNSEDPIRYASETLDSAATTKGINANNGVTFFNIIDTGDNKLDLVGELGAEAETFFAGFNLFFRVDLDGAAFSTTLTGNELTVTTVGTSDVISQGGSAGESHVIYQITPVANNVANDTFTLPLAGIAILADQEIRVSYSTYSTVADALNSQNAVSSGSVTYVELVGGVSVQADARDQQVNAEVGLNYYVVQSPSTNLTGTVATLGKLVVTSTNGGELGEVYDQAGSLHVLSDSVVDADITISGDFSTGTYYLDTSITCPSSATPPTNSAGGALTFAEDMRSATQTLAVLNTNEWLCHIVDEDMAIPESTYEVVFDYQSATGSQEIADGVSAFGSVTNSEDLELDTDGDGIPDFEDAFPNNPEESLDTDLDGIGNNEDLDDDNDGLPDMYEAANGFDSLEPSDAVGDADGDLISNLVEFQLGTDPNDPTDGGDACVVGVPSVASQSEMPIETLLAFANPGSNLDQQTFVRLSNPNATSTDMEIYAVDDTGQTSRRGPLTLTLDPEASVQLTAQDLEAGSLAKGLDNDLCDGQGKWVLKIRSENQINAMGLIRTRDGFLTGMSETVPRKGNRHQIYFFNPASNVNQQSFVRISNLSSVDVNVSISGVDDSGTPGQSDLTLSLQPEQSVQLTSEDLETGNPEKGLTGALGSGSGKWRLEMFSPFELAVTSLIRSSDGFLTNLSSVVPGDLGNNHYLYYVNPASETEKQSFIRVINISDNVGTVTISATDDDGNIAPGGDVSFSIGANESKQFTIQDLEEGNLEKGLLGSFGDGAGRWRLNIDADLDVELQVMNLIRTLDGFLTNVSAVTLPSQTGNTVDFFNPGSNLNQQSVLRVVNESNQVANITVSGIDDTGNSAPGGTVTFELPQQSSLTLTAQDLEGGNTSLGLVGAMGNGSGKWRLNVISDVAVQVQSILETPNGFVTNLSSSVSGTTE